MYPTNSSRNPKYPSMQNIKRLKISINAKHLKSQWSRRICYWNEQALCGPLKENRDSINIAQ